MLAVGISAYPGRLTLRYAHKDAEDLGKTWKEKCGRLFRDVEILPVTEKDATADGIRKGLAWLKGKATEQDVVVVSFAGHGFVDDKGVFYLLPVDGDIKNLPRTAISAAQLKAALEELRCRRVLVLLDACHSGRWRHRPAQPRGPQ